MDGSLAMSDDLVLFSFEPLVQDNRWQNEQWAKLAESGLPTSKDEAWKYTSLDRFRPVSYTHLTLPTIYSV